MDYFTPIYIGCKPPKGEKGEITQFTNDGYDHFRPDTLNINKNIIILVVTIASWMGEGEPKGFCFFSDFSGHQEGDPFPQIGDPQNPQATNPFLVGWFGRTLGTLMT